MGSGGEAARRSSNSSSVRLTKVWHVTSGPDIRLRDVAERAGITERATQRILAELVETGYVKTSRVGRRNSYTVDREHAMRHTAQLGYEIGALIEALTENDRPRAEH